jgi:hypothetical protein
MTPKEHQLRAALDRAHEASVAWDRYLSARGAVEAERVRAARAVLRANVKVSRRVINPAAVDAALRILDARCESTSRIAKLVKERDERWKAWFELTHLPKEG